MSEPRTNDSVDEKTDRGLRRRFGLLTSTLGPFLALGVVIAFFGVADSMQSDGGMFLTVGNLQRISAQTATVAVAALGMTIVIIAGGIDLSAGTALALCATMLAWSLREDVALYAVHGTNVASARERLDDAISDVENLERRAERIRGNEDRRRELLAEKEQVAATIPALRETLRAVEEASPRLTPWTPWAAVALAVLTGCLCGLVNGVLISYLKVVPFIVTLGTMTVYLGLATIIANETTVRPDKVTQIPDWLELFLSSREQALVAGLPVGIWLALLLAILLAAVLRYTVFGRYVFALGSNEATARLCGIDVERNKIAVYTLAGFFVGVAGLYQFSRLSVGNPSSGTGMELDIIAAVVIGGGSLSGGRGSVLGTLTGAAIMAVITSGCTQLGLSNPLQRIILGVIIITAVTIDQIRQRRLAT